MNDTEALAAALRPLKIVHAACHEFGQLIQVGFAPSAAQSHNTTSAHASHFLQQLNTYFHDQPKYTQHHE